MSKNEQGLRLYQAIERLCMQAGTDPDETVDWLCGQHGGMSKLFQSYFSPKEPNGEPLANQLANQAETSGSPVQQEPVAWYYRFKNKSGWTAWMTTPVGSEKPVNVAFEDMECRPLVFGDTSPPAQRKPLTDEQIDRAIAELGLNYFADAANNRAVLRELCRKAAHGTTKGNT